MFRVDAKKPVHFCDGLTRRDFLHAGSLTALGLGLPAMQALASSGAIAPDRDVNCILLFLVGGPSQLDTWDMKPDAPEEIRGPFRPIATKVPGVQVSEIFPRLADDDGQGVAGPLGLSHGGGGPRHGPPDDADRPAVHRRHRASAVWLGPRQGERLAARHAALCAAAQADRADRRQPAARARRRVSRQDVSTRSSSTPIPTTRRSRSPTCCRRTTSRPCASRGGGRSASAIDGAVGSFESSADARLLDANFEGAFKLMSSPQAREAFEIAAEPAAIRDRYGRTRFGQSCLLARRLIERGVRFVTVNMFETVFNEITWDIHGSAPFSPIECYKNEVGPNFDNAYTALLEDLERRGMLETTMVLAFGEFGRTPKINPAGGRDHHPACWTVLFAGGPIQGGRVVGRLRRDRLCPQGPAGHHRRDRRHRLSRARHRPGHRAPRPPEPAAPPRRPRRRADPGTLLIRRSD